MKRSHEPRPGKMAKRSLRTTFNAIATKLKNGRLSNKEFMALVAYQRELRAELKEKEKAKIEAELAELDKSEPAGTEGSK